MTADKDNGNALEWGRATREGATREQLRRWSRLTLEEIIAAQEEMAELSQRLNPAPAKQPRGK